MSHEIRTPMNGVLRMLHLLLGTELNGEQLELAQTARPSAESLLTIINDILDFSRIEEGKLTVERIPFDVQGETKAAVELLADRARQKNLSLVCEIEASVPRLVIGDSGRLRQVITNLLGNALKCTHTGEVALRVLRTSGDLVRFEVRTPASGYQPRSRSSYFSLFVQAVPPPGDMEERGWACPSSGNWCT